MTEKERAQYLDAIFDYIDTCFRYGEFNLVDKILGALCEGFNKLEDSILLGYLTITYAAKSKLPNRQKLFELAREKYKNDERRLLQGLE